MWQNGAVSQLPLPPGETLGDANSVNAYNQLFVKPTPDAANFAADLNPQSLEILTDARCQVRDSRNQLL